MFRKIINIFRQDIYAFPMALDTKDLIDYIYNLKQNDKGRKVSNLGGWQSNDLDLSDKKLESLCIQIQIHSKHFLKHLNLKGKFSLGNMWANVNGYKDSNEMHVHPNSVISGVYFLKASKKQGSLRFVSNYNYELNACYNSFIENPLPQNNSLFDINPEDNTLILFPSYLKHYVLPNMEKDKDRISISFNIS